MIGSPLLKGGAHSTVSVVELDRPGIGERLTPHAASGAPGVVCVPEALALLLEPRELAALTLTV